MTRSELAGLMATADSAALLGELTRELPRKTVSPYPFSARASAVGDEERRKGGQWILDGTGPEKLHVAAEIDPVERGDQIYELGFIRREEL